MQPQGTDSSPPTPREISEHRGLVRGLLLVMLLVLVLGAFSSPSLAASPHAPALPHPSPPVAVSAHAPASANPAITFSPKFSNFVPNSHASHQVTAPKVAPNGLPVGSATAHASVSRTQRALTPNAAALPLTIVAGANPPSGWAPLPVNLTSGVGGGVPPYTYSWNYGDGSPLSGAPDPNHVYNLTSAGWVYPSIIVTDSATNTASTNFALYVGWQGIQVDAAAAPPVGPVPFTTTFHSSVGGARGAVTWLWNFGDGPETSAYATPTHTYNYSGWFYPTVTVTDAQGDTNNYQLGVYAQNIYFEASVLASPPSGTIPLSVAFQGTASGGNPPYTYSWNFGDGSLASPLQNPTHIYTTTGPFVATLTVTDSMARSTTSTVTVDPTTSSPPLAASLIAMNPSGMLPLPVQFSSAVSGGTPPYFTSIAFGDGSPPSNSPDPLHAYNSSSATYTVTLGVVDHVRASVRVTVAVNPSAIPLLEDALVSIPTNVVLPGQTDNFTAFAGGGAPPYQFSWAWGDGQNGSLGATASRIIGAQCLGVYPVVMDGLGGNAGATSYYSLCPNSLPEQLSLTASPPVGLAPLTVNFNGSVGGSFQTGKLLWDFGDGTTGVGNTPTHVFSVPGSYDVRFWTLDRQGNLFSTDQQVVVTSPGGFVVSACCTGGGNTPSQMFFSSYIQSGGTGPFTYLWNFGDGTRSTLWNPAHIFTAAGTFVVNLTVTDSTGLVAGYDLTYRTQGGTFPLAAAISTSSDSGPAPLSVDYQGLVTGGVPPYQYDWWWGDDLATGSSSPDPSHVWNESSWNYGPSLVVVDSALQRASVQTASQTSWAGAHVSISASPESGLVPLTVAFQAFPSATAQAYSYHWSFGDNSAGSASPTPVHTYNRTGNYWVQVRYLDSEGYFVGSNSVQIFVGPTSEVLTAAADPTNGVAPLVVVFHSTLSSYTSGNYYNWNYGDGSPVSNFPNPTHQFNATGTYTVRLTVVDSLGTILSQSLTVNVVASSPPLSASVIPSSVLGLAPLPVSFQAFASGGTGPYAYLWNFGDGSPSSGSPSPAHVYNLSGTYTAMLHVTSGASTILVTTTIYVIMAPLLINIATNPESAPAPLTVAFLGEASGGTGHYSYFWNFGDGSFSSLANPTHTFTRENTNFNIQLNVQDPRAGTSSTGFTVYTTNNNPDPEVDLWSDHPSGLAPTQVTFGSTVSGGIAPYNLTWNFGDGAVGFGASPTHIYSVPGSYNVNCFVRDSQYYSSNTQIQEIIGQGGPTVNVVLSATPTSGAAPLGVQFSTVVSGGTPPYFYGWNFNDGGGPSGSPRPYHVYNQTGNFYANVVVFDSAGYGTFASVTILVQSPNLVANILSTPSSGKVPLTVAFTSTVDGGVAPYTYAWTFGDGAPVSGSPTPVHTYNASGTFTVQLSVTDSSGTSTGANVVVIVGSGSVPLSAWAQATPTAGFAPTTVVFTGGAWGGTGPYTYRWNFGDGSLGSLYADPTHVYNGSGGFGAMLMVMDANGSVANAQISLQVSWSQVAPSFTFTPATGMAPLNVAFNGSVSGGLAPYTWSWDFGDGATSAARNPVHVYNSSGPFSATLTVTDSRGVVGSTMNQVKVGPTPLTLRGSATPSAGAVPLVVDFSTWAVGGSPGYSYSWTFGDSTSTTGRYVNHTYSATGTFTATETVLDNIGTVAWQSFSINVVTGLVATAGAAPTSTDVGLPVSFAGSATGGQPGYTYAWTFGDGGTSTAQRPSHAYALAGTYTASLTVTDAIGLTSISTVGITVNALPTAAGLAAPNPADVGTTVAFTGSVSGGTAPLAYSWNYGDGSPSSGYLTPTHVYNVSGTFSAIFTVTDAVGAVSSQPVAVAVNEVPGVTFTAAPNPTDVGTPVAFTSGVTFGTAPYT
ncbi:MAG: PKD domain-containing protein, partial [Euryarchaeota archaeon]|nr:PKD domain-containing protein [Euryarchaeota archaeon]